MHAVLSALYRVRPDHTHNVDIYNRRGDLIAEFSAGDMEIKSHTENISFAYELTCESFKDKSATSHHGFLAMRDIWANLARCADDYRRDFNSYPDSYTISLKGLNHATGYACSINIAMAFPSGIFGLSDKYGEYHDLTTRTIKYTKVVK